MDNYAKLIQPGKLKIERILPGPIERVWEYLTNGQKRGLWFASGEMEMKEGGQMKLIFNNSKLSSIQDPIPEKYKEYGDGYTSEAVVETIEPPHLLVIIWDGRVTFELEESGDEVKLTLIHEQLPEGDERIGAMAGWHTHLDILVDRLSNREPKGFWKVHMDLEDEYRSREG